MMGDSELTVLYRWQSVSSSHGSEKGFNATPNMLSSQTPSTVNQMSLPLGAELFLTVVLAIVICVAIFGNSMVCLAIFRSRTLRAQVANVFIVNLAITDLGCASLVMPFSLISVWLDHWIFGSFLCDVACFFNYCFIIVSMLSLALISVDRHIYVVHPFRYQSTVTHRRAIILVLCTWVVGFVFAATPPIMRWVIFDNAEIICAIDWESDHTAILAYTVSAFVICFMSPIVVMVYCYIGIYRVAKEHAKRIAPPHIVGRIETGQPEERDSNANGTTYLQEEVTNHAKTSTLASQNSQKRTTSPKNKTSGFYSNKAIRSILVMILAYVICNTPFSLTKLIKVIKINNEAVPFYINTAASWFGFVNPCCNPIIYSILREDFRNAFIKLLPLAISKRFKQGLDGNSLRSQIIGNSPRLTTKIRSNVTVNIINPSPTKRSPALIENPLQCYEDDFDATNENVNVNNAVEATVNDIGYDDASRSQGLNNGNLSRKSSLRSTNAPTRSVPCQPSQISDDELYTDTEQSSPPQSCQWSSGRSSSVSRTHATLNDISSLGTTVSV